MTGGVRAPDGRRVGRLPRGHRARRRDDHPGAALDYYGSRGETPLRWGGRGTRLLGLCGLVDLRDYKAIFGPGGGADPDTRIRLANTKRPGMELVVSAHKSVAELGVIGRADDMHPSSTLSATPPSSTSNS